MAHKLKQYIAHKLSIAQANECATTHLSHTHMSLKNVSRPDPRTRSTSQVIPMLNPDGVINGNLRCNMNVRGRIGACVGG